MATTDPDIRLKDAELSAIYQTADKLSGAGQRKTKRLVRTELIALAVASGAGVTTVRVTSHELDVLALISAIAFIVSLVCTLRRAQRKPEEDWYKGRASAESVRTLAWKYSIGARPFPIGGDDEDERQFARLFLDRLANVVRYVEDAELPPPNSEASELTEPMKRLRASNLAVRRRIYQRDRIENQLKWYAGRSREHDKWAQRWLRTAIVASATGIVMAAMRFFFVDVDLLGVFAAVASGAIAWSQLNQHRNQATAYALAARELNIIHDQIEHVLDDEWATFAEGAEDAISREHTTWAARRGYGMPTS